MFFLVTLIPLVALAIKRVHDIDFSGFWLLLILIPKCIGLLIVVFLLALPGDKEENNYGGVVK